MAFGGMSFVTKMALNTAEFLRNKPWTQNTFEEAMDVLVKEFPLPPNVPGAMNRYRQTLTISLFFKSYLELSQPSMLDSSELSSTGVFHKEPLRGAQLYEIVPKGQLILKCPYEMIVSSKIPTKSCLDFCPEIFCSFLGASLKLFGLPGDLVINIINKEAYRKPKKSSRKP